MNQIREGLWAAYSALGIYSDRFEDLMFTKEEGLAWETLLELGVPGDIKLSRKKDFLVRMCEASILLSKDTK